MFSEQKVKMRYTDPKIPPLVMSHRILKDQNECFKN